MKKRLVTVLTAALVLAACGQSTDEASEATQVAPVKNAALPQKTTTTVKPTGTASTATPPLPVPTTLPPRAIHTTVARNPVTTTTRVPPTTTSTTLVPIAVPAQGPNACPAQGPCKIGQTGPAGGIVFYAASTPQKWGQYLEVRREAFEQIVADTCNLSAYSTYATGKIGDGLTQTAAVIAACAKDKKPSAAGSYARVNAYTQNGYSK